MVNHSLARKPEEELAKSQASTGNANVKSKGESKPSFSGNWQRSESLDAGTTLTISHRRSVLSVTHSRSALARKSITKNIYHIDGRAHITTRTEYYEDSSTNQKHRYKTSKVRSVVKWDGDKLVIVDDNGQSEWELSESGRELILTDGKKGWSINGFLEETSAQKRHPVDAGNQGEKARRGGETGFDPQPDRPSNVNFDETDLEPDTRSAPTASPSRMALACAFVSARFWPSSKTSLHTLTRLSDQTFESGGTDYEITKHYHNTRCD